MARKVDKAIVFFEVILGVISLGVALWAASISTQESDPHTFMLLGAWFLGLFGFVSFSCGVLYKFSKRARVPSQIVLVLTSMFIYIEMFTS